MESNFRAFDSQRQHTSTFPMSSSSSFTNYTFFSDQPIKDGLWSGRSLEPADLRQRMRSEIIAEQVERRSYFEAEVRREMMMEREMMVMHTGEFPPSFILAPPPRSHYHHRFEPEIYLHSEPFPPDNRIIAMPLPETYGGGGGYHSNIGGFEVVPFQRPPTSPKIKEITGYLPKDVKEETIDLGKLFGPPVSGLKRKTSPVGEHSTGLNSDNLRKKVKEEWSCAICEVSATSAQGLNDHIAGKKHQAKMAALKTNNNGAETGLGKIKKSTKKSTKCDSVDSTKHKSKFWCKMCKVEACDEKMMSQHRQGKKHLKNVKKARAKNKPHRK